MSTGYDPNFNPYQPPSHPPQGQWATQGASSVSPAIVESLRKTRPWVMLLAVLGSIWAGFCVLGALGLLVAGPAALALVYLVFAGIYMLPIVNMYRFAGAINRLQHGGGQQELEQAMEAQQNFWQVIGIMTLVGMVLGIMMAIGMVMFAATVAESMRF
jgi:fatty-acid desaturase